MMKVLLTLFLASLLLGGVVAALVPVRPLSIELSRAEVADSSLQVRAMFEQFPRESPRMFELYGSAPEFGEVLRRYGHNQIVPIVDKCFQQGDPVIQLLGRLRSLVQGLGDQPLTPEECGFMALQLTVAMGNDFLGQFVTDANGQALRLPASTVAAFAKSLLTGGLQKLERRAVLGERPTGEELFYGGADLVGIVGIWKAIALHAAKATAAKVGAGVALATLSTATKVGVVGGVIYFTTHPGVALSTLATVGKQLGVPPWLSTTLGVGLALFTLLVLLAWCSWMLRPVVWVCRIALRSLRSRHPKIT